MIMPDKIVGDHMASLLMVPDLIRFGGIELAESRQSQLGGDCH